VTVCGWQNSADEIEQSRLAAPGRAQQSEELALPHFERYVFERQHLSANRRAVMVTDVFDNDLSRIAHRYPSRTAPANLMSRHRCRKLSTGEMRRQVVNHQLAHRGAGLDRRAAMMWLQQDIGQFEEIRRDAWRIQEHVKRSKAEPSVAQALDHSGLVHHGAARDID